MVLSPRAGGVGLTLTAANHVIHLSRWWNPAVEDQCTDRTYRIGQENAVPVYLPRALHPEFGEHSFDCRLHALLERKRQLSREFLRPTAMTQDDVEALFRETVQARREAPQPEVTLEEIDAMDPLQFERWAMGRLQSVGYQVDATPQSGDAGADIVARDAYAGLPDLIVQCKHTQTGSTCGVGAVKEVLRAQIAYELEMPRLAVVTNAPKFSTEARSLANANEISLVARHQLVEWPRPVLQ